MYRKEVEVNSSLKKGHDMHGRHMKIFQEEGRKVRKILHTESE
jgi:hypothetical protein